MFPSERCVNDRRSSFDRRDLEVARGRGGRGVERDRLAVREAKSGNRTTDIVAFAFIPVGEIKNAVEFRADRNFVGSSVTEPKENDRSVGQGHGHLGHFFADHCKFGRHPGLSSRGDNFQTSRHAGEAGDGHFQTIVGAPGNRGHGQVVRGLTGGGEGGGHGILGRFGTVLGDRDDGGAGESQRKGHQDDGHENEQINSGHFDPPFIWFVFFATLYKRWRLIANWATGFYGLMPIVPATKLSFPTDNAVPSGLITKSAEEPVIWFPDLVIVPVVMGVLLTTSPSL